jgi:hypothetical protein
MSPTYPGFHYWWQQRRPQLAQHGQEQIPLYAWPQEPPKDKVPTAPDPLDYGRVALEW